MIFNIQRYSTHDGPVYSNRGIPERLLAGLSLVSEPGKPLPQPGRAV